MLGKIKKGTTEDEMIGWHHRLNEHEFEQTQEVMRDRQAWHAAVHVVTRVRHDLVTEKQQLPIYVYLFTYL